MITMAPHRRLLQRLLSTGAGSRPPVMQGMTVVELASVLAGPSVCQFLAELGAKVIKVENTTTAGDVTRTWRLAADSSDSDVTAYFASCNLGKRSVALNMRDPRGLEAVHKLVRAADVVVASYKPGDAEKLGVDYATLSGLNPSLVYAQITGYGLDDPRAGYDAVIQAESGFQFMNGSPESSPTKMPVALMDLLAAHQLKEALLTRLWQRERGYGGAFVSVSLLAAGVSSLANQATGYLRAGVVPQRMGSDHPSICPYGSIFECRDGKLLTLAIGSDKQFAQLCAVLGEPALATDSRFATNPSRVAHREECKANVRRLVSRHDRAELLGLLRERAVPAGGVNDLAAVFALPQAEALVVRGEEGQARGVRQVAFESGGTSGAVDERVDLTPPPRYAEHTSEVLSEVAGLTESELRELLDDGVAVDSFQTVAED